MACWSLLSFCAALQDIGPSSALKLKCLLPWRSRNGGSLLWGLPVAGSGCVVGVGLLQISILRPRKQLCTLFLPLCSLKLHQHLTLWHLCEQNSRRLVAVQGGSKRTIFVSPPTPSSVPLLLSLVSAKAFHWYLYFPPWQGEAFQARELSHRHWILLKVGCTPTSSFAIGCLQSHVPQGCFCTPPPQICCPLCSLKHFCAWMWSFFFCCCWQSVWVSSSS